MKAIQDLISKAERFLESARHLLAIGDYDSCASRCYYAALHMAQAALLLKGLTPSSHSGVLRLFGQHFIRTGIFPPDLGRILSRAYDIRLAGDYEAGLSVSRQTAEKLLQDTQYLVAKIRSYLISEDS